MAINPDKCIKVTGRFHSTQGTVGEPALTNVVAGADEVYDDTVPYRYNGHIDCKEVTPVGTENPQELEWFEKVYNTLEPTLFEWVKTTDTSVDSEKTYGISIGAKQSDVNKQLYDRLDDIYEVTINADDVSKVITSDANKIINKEDGYVPTAAAVGEALGANFEDSLTSTSVVKGLTANMGRELNETKANKNGWYEQLVSGASLSLIGDDVDHKATFLERETGDSTATGGINYSVDKGTATIETIYGHTEKFNQLFKGNIGERTVNGIQLSFTNGHIVGQGTPLLETTTSILSGVDVPATMAGHKYFIGFKGSYSNCNIRFYHGSYTPNLTESVIITATGASNVGYTIQCLNTNPVSVDVHLWYHDLTAIFGAGNEPSTVEEFEAWLANNIGIQDYYDYTPGTLISLNPDSLVSTGFNQWDEEWELGSISNIDGSNIVGTTTIRSKNYIELISGNNYFFKCPSIAALRFYDSDKNFISPTSIINDIINIPIGATYLRFVMLATYGTTYNNDICINISNPAKNGTYEPYREPSTVDLSWIKDIPDPNDSSKKLFPYGLLKAGNICDEVTATKAIKRIGSVDMGTLIWRVDSGAERVGVYYSTGLSNTHKTGDTYSIANLIVPGYETTTVRIVDAAGHNMTTGSKLIGSGTQVFIQNWAFDGYSSAQVATALTGVPLYYELATPIEVTFEEPNTHPMNYEVEDGGREKMLPENTSTPTTTSLVADIRYPLNALEAIRNLQNNFSTQGALYQTFNSLCSALNSAITTGTFAVTPDETVVGKFNFTFTPTENTQSVESNETI